MMSFQYDFALIGGDDRQLYMADFLVKKGMSVCGFGLPLDNKKKRVIPAFLNGQVTMMETLKEAVINSQYLIGPIPFTKDHLHIFSTSCDKCMLIEDVYRNMINTQTLFAGVITKEESEHFYENHLSIIDLMKCEEVAILNAIATAEGAIYEAILHSTTNLHQRECLILGFGRCGQILASKLKGLDCNVTIVVRKSDALAYAKAYGYNSFPIDELKKKIHEFDYIFNTIPALIMNKHILCEVSREATIIDLATAPGGLDYEYVKLHEINANLCLGLPGIISPKSSAEILCSRIFELTSIK